MCRLAAFCPGTTRDEAMEILLNMEGGNTDGYGESYVKDGKFVLKKYRDSFSDVVRKRLHPLSHMPYDGWTIAHQRASTHGHVCKANSHPFIIDGKWSFCHNGVWNSHDIVRSIFIRQGKRFLSDVDSETAGMVFSTIGPRMFNLQMESCGVFLALNINGELHAIKTAGQMEINVNPNKSILIASDLDFSVYPDSIIAAQGWYQFDKEGKFVKYTSRAGKSSLEIPEKTYGYQGNATTLPSCYYSPKEYAMRNHYVEGYHGID